MEQARGVKLRIIKENSKFSPTSLDGSFTSYQNTIDRSSLVAGMADAGITPQSKVSSVQSQKTLPKAQT